MASLQIANVIYLDSPSGVGLSYSETVTDYVTNDTQTALDTLTFLEAFFREFPEFSGNRFYITGDWLLLAVLNSGRLRYVSCLADSSFMAQPFPITCSPEKDKSKPVSTTSNASAVMPNRSQLPQEEAQIWAPWKHERAYDARKLHFPFDCHFFRPLSTAMCLSVLRYCLEP